MASQHPDKQREESANRQQLKALIHEGINAPHVPADKAEGQLRRYADRLAGKHAP